MIIGFGSTEQDFEDAEREAMQAKLVELYSHERGYFDDKTVNAFKKWLDARAAEYHRLGKVYRTAAEYPSRYAYYWPHVIADANYVVIILSVHNVNRRHGLSPDGWALLVTKPTFAFEALEISDAKRKAV